MYSQQQYPQFPQTGLQQVVDDINGPLYHQRQIDLPPIGYPASTQESANGGGVHGKSAAPSDGSYALPYQPAEPTPSTTDNPTVPPTTFQLAEFVTNMIYLLWHARHSTMLNLHLASSSQPTLTPAIAFDLGNANPSFSLKNSNIAFHTFCQQVKTLQNIRPTYSLYSFRSYQVLTATQLSEAVVILGLKYVAKLLEANPHIQGADGSEYRLFIVALMLGKLPLKIFFIH